MSQMEDLKIGQPYSIMNDKPKPEAEECQFCGKILEYQPVKHPFENRIWAWKKPEGCNCKQAVNFREEQTRKKAEEEQKLLEEERREIEKQRIERLFEMSKMGARFKTRTFETFEVNSKNEKIYNMSKSYCNNFEQAKKERFRYFICR